jgi:hypothetical protein
MDGSANSRFEPWPQARPRERRRRTEISFASTTSASSRCGLFFCQRPEEPLPAAFKELSRIAAPASSRRSVGPAAIIARITN